MKKSYIIAGPTASGKSDFANALARRVGGTIINADSVQLYKGIEILSSAPTSHSTLHTPHSLYSFLPLDQQTTVAEYLEWARREYDAANVPIFVGGSGMYIDALIRGISPVPPVTAENRMRARKIVIETPAAARQLTDFEFTDTQRMMRALEVFLETGRPITEWQKLPRVGKLPGNPVKILINPPTDILNDRIRKRLDIMIENGAIEEARANINFPDRCIGIEELGKYINGKITLAVALNNLAVRTSQYAKRQKTWFRNKFPADVVIPRVPANTDIDNVLL